MKVCAVICELNPLHKGHEFLFETAKSLSEADYLIAIMSGDFVQRGLPAICDKYLRTRMALRAGADLVIELPVKYATASADYFAYGAVSIADRIGLVDKLCFGSDSGDISLLKEYAHDAEKLYPAYGGRGDEDTKGYIDPNAVLDCVRQGVSYARAVNNMTGKKLLSNDMLASCYIRSLNMLSSDIEALPVKRKGSNYLADCDDADSATAIRRRIFEKKEYADLLPDYVNDMIRTAGKGSFPVFPESFDAILYSKIDSVLRDEARGLDSLTSYMDVSLNIAGHIRSEIFEYRGYSDFVYAVHSKEYTKSRIMRALLHILLDIRKSDYPENIGRIDDLYARILGFKKNASPLLKELKERSSIPVIAKAKDADRILGQKQYASFEKDIYAANLYEKCCAFNKGMRPIHDFSKEIIIM